LDTNRRKRKEKESGERKLEGEGEKGLGLTACSRRDSPAYLLRSCKRAITVYYWRCC
jgi:hypothetical protein